MTIPPHLVGKVYDDHTRQAIRNLLSRFSVLRLRQLKRMLADGTYDKIFPETQVFDILQMTVEELEGCPRQQSTLPGEGGESTTPPDQVQAQEDEHPEVVPQDPLTQYIQGNIQEYGFVAHTDAQRFFEEHHLGPFNRFSEKLTQAVRQTRQTLNCRISKVAVPSLVSSQLITIYAKERDKRRRNSWELAVHQYFLNGLAKLIEALGHHLKHRHALPNGKFNDLFVESRQTGQTGHIEIKTGAAVTRQDFLHIREPYLVITPWQKRPGKTMPVGPNKKRLPIPLGEADVVKVIVNHLGENYSVLAVHDPDFKAKLAAWINTGHLERAVTDPTHRKGKR